MLKKRDKKPRGVDINDLYFGVTLYEMSYTGGEKRELRTYNLFDSSRIRRSVASWVVMSDKDKMYFDPLLYCFGDVWGRCEWEFVICPWGGLNENDKVMDVGTKVDVYTMFVEPNAKLLMDMVNSVSISSATRVLAEERKLYREFKKRVQSRKAD